MTLLGRLPSVRDHEGLPRFDDALGASQPRECRKRGQVRMADIVDLRLAII